MLFEIFFFVRFILCLVIDEMIRHNLIFSTYHFYALVNRRNGKNTSMWILPHFISLFLMVDLAHYPGTL